MGFTEVTTAEIDGSGSHVRHFRHDRTGADVVFLLNSDAAKTFSIAFRTHPTDSTGVAHVLEHCVLSGSRAYPVDQVFTELLKGSLQSYLNASTFADFTIYAVASPHRQDFTNLVNVYLDAVFFPLLSADCFRREGWHRAADGSQQGVVLNEMRGACASPTFKLAEQARRSLFREGPFSHAHGGDPERITDLTLEALRQFHQRFYHPSNALAAYSGVDDIQCELRRLDRAFDQFERRDPPHVRSWQAVKAPQTSTFSYAGQGPSFLALNWAFPEPADRLAELAYEVLCELLVGQPFAPLRRALIDADHCADVIEGRFCSDTSPPRLSIQLAGVSPDRLDDLQQAVRKALERLAQKGFDALTLAGALNTIEFRYRDRGTWKRPHALGLLLDMTKAWRLDRDTLDGLRFARELGELRHQPPGFFEEMLRMHVLQNPRQTIVMLAPDGITSDSLSKAPLPHSPDAYRKKTRGTINVPCLELQDLSSKNAELPIKHDKVGETPVLLHRRATSGLTYVDLALDLQGIEQLSCAALFGRILLQSGTARHSAHEMSRMIGAETGGLSVEIVSAPLANRQGTATHLVLRARALTEQTFRLFDILGEVLNEAVVPEPRRLIEIIRSEIIRIRAQIIPKAHDFLDRRLRAPVSELEKADGLSYLSFLYEFHALLLRNPDQARQRFNDMQATLLCQKRLVVSVIHDQSSAPLRPIKRLIDSLPEGKSAKASGHQRSSKISEAFILPTEMNFVGAAFDMASEMTRPASLAVALRWIENNWLRQKIREEGGAYGVRCRGDASGRIITFLSYRDPHILRTLDAFSSAGRHLAVEMNKNDLTRSIITTIGEMDRPKSPSDCGFEALTDWLIGQTSEQRHALRAQVLTTEIYDLKSFADLLISVDPQFAVIGRDSKVLCALIKRPGLFNLNKLPDNGV